MAEDRAARSFIERYVIARAGLFRAEFEQEDLWACTQMAKSAYRMIADVAKTAEPSPDTADPFVNTGHGMIAGNGMIAPGAHGGPGGGFAQAHTALMRHRAAQQTKPPGPLTRAFRALNLKGEPV